MQGKHLYEYAVIRLVPRVEREEFFNVGIITKIVEQNFLYLEKTVEEINGIVTVE